jgi:hypothetical protein
LEVGKTTSRAVLPDFSLYSIQKRGKIYQTTPKSTKWPQNMPNWDFGLKINHLATLLHSRATFVIF